MHEPPTIAEQFIDRLERRTTPLAILGLGYVGLPLAEAFVQAGFRVLGFDVAPDRVQALLGGESYLGHFPAERVRDLLATNRFTPTGDEKALAEAEAFLLCVPTPLNAAREPDLSAVEAAARIVAPHLRPGSLVVLESTTYPGTTRQVLWPLLQTPERILGETTFVAFSPEREDPGNRDFTTRRIPRLVGGLDEPSGRVACALYRQALEQVILVRNAEVAEAGKILENTYRAVNIALVNELKMLYDRLEIDIWEVIEAARSKPFGFQPFYPGPGWGGHCIPIDPYYLAWVGRQVGQPTRFVELAGEINRAMPHYVLRKLTESLERPLAGSRILLIGMAYKRDVDDIRESPGLELLHLLRQGGTHVEYHDPHVPRVIQGETRLESVPLTESGLAAQDAVLIVTDHRACDWEAIATHARLVVDTRNALRDIRSPRARVIRA